MVLGGKTYNSGKTGGGANIHTYILGLNTKGFLILLYNLSSLLEYSTSQLTKNVFIILHCVLITASFIKPYQNRVYKCVGSP